MRDTKLILGIIFFLVNHLAPVKCTDIESCRVTNSRGGVHQPMTINVTYAAGGHQRIYIDLYGLQLYTDYDNGCSPTNSATSLPPFTDCRHDMFGILLCYGEDNILITNTNITIYSFNFPEQGISFANDVLLIHAFDGNNWSGKYCEAFTVPSIYRNI